MKDMQRYPHHPIPPRPEEAMIQHLWTKICKTFATNEEVCKLATELQRVESIQGAQSAQVASAAAALVTKQVQNDLNLLKDDIYNHLQKVDSFSIEISPQADKYNRPCIRSPKYNTIYLTLSEKAEDNDMWDEWIAIPRKIGNRESYRWERLGSKKIDLSWVHQSFDTVNQSIEDLQNRMKNFSEAVQKAILEKAVRPIEELRDYINSPEFIAYVFDQLPRASLGGDGLMTANAVALLQGLALWAGNDQKVLGGGAMGADYVIRAMEYYGINCDDLKTNECGHDSIYPEFNFPRG